MLFPQMEALVFEHIRSVRREGKRSLLMISLVGTGLLLTIFLFSEISTTGWVAIGIIGGGLLLLLFGLALPNLRGSGNFILRIYASRIVCESPVPSLAPSFDLVLTDIDHIEHDTRGDSSHWIIVVRDGSRFKITEEYSLPLKKVIHILMATDPPLKVVELTQWKTPWSRKKET